MTIAMLPNRRSTVSVSRTGSIYSSLPSQFLSVFLAGREVLPDHLLTHSPAYQLGDGQDLPHTGFRAFNALLERYNPRYFVHGHTHMTYGRSYQRVTVINNNEIGELSQKLYNTLTDIQWSRIPDPFGWITPCGVTISSPILKKTFIAPTSSTYLRSTPSSQRTCE